jgi:hypothetical protein
VSKRAGVEKLTPACALVAEPVRRYWILGIECSLLEIQKLAYLLERSVEKLGLNNPLDLRFQADKYGPYAPRLTHLLDGLDGSYPALFTARWRMWLNLLIQCMILVSNQNNAVSGKPHPP